jgi:hypothetical protein
VEKSPAFASVLHPKGRVCGWPDFWQRDLAVAQRLSFSSVAFPVFSPRLIASIHPVTAASRPVCVAGREEQTHGLVL